MYLIKTCIFGKSNQFHGKMKSFPVLKDATKQTLTYYQCPLGVENHPFVIRLRRYLLCGLTEFFGMTAFSYTFPSLLWNRKSKILKFLHCEQYHLTKLFQRSVFTKVFRCKHGIGFFFSFSFFFSFCDSTFR